jgi:hypothetical protein
LDLISLRISNILTYFPISRKSNINTFPATISPAFFYPGTPSTIFVISARPFLRFPPTETIRKRQDSNDERDSWQQLQTKSMQSLLKTIILNPFRGFEWIYRSWKSWMIGNRNISNSLSRRESH